MTEIDLLKCKLEEERKAFDKLHKKHMDLLKQQGELEKENEQLKRLIQKTLETTPIEHNLAVELKNSVRELYD